jgi:hypothetical protein
MRMRKRHILVEMIIVWFHWLLVLAFRPASSHPVETLTLRLIMSALPVALLRSSYLPPPPFDLADLIPFAGECSALDFGGAAA